MTHASGKLSVNTPATDLPLTVLKGIGEKLAERLQKLGLFSLYDLCFHLPSRYEDRTRLTPLKRVRPGQLAVVEGEIVATEMKYHPRVMLCVRLRDDSGELSARFFQFNKHQRARLQVGARLRCFGEVRWVGRNLELSHPETEILGDVSPPMPDTLSPIYPLTEGVSQTKLRNLIQSALQLCARSIGTTDLLPAELLSSENLPSLVDALMFVHTPPPNARLSELEERSHPAQRRLVLEELLAHYLSLRKIRATSASYRAPSLSGPALLKETFLANLPYQLTAAQQRVVAELEQDMERATPMQRLLQGDVGSGKTVVAALALIKAMAANYQAVFMAPTELLAEQHLRNLHGWLMPLGIEPVLLSGGLPKKARNELIAKLATGDIRVVIGTHALLQDDVQFARLGLIVIDEQHRFGVDQRFKLWRKGQNDATLPHQLIMTATPIPRTLAMAFYGDLDVSVIDELPPGRTPVETVTISARRRPDVVLRIAHACAEGRQIYWVCALIEESEVLQCQAATVSYEQLTHELPQLRIGLIHGRLSRDEKDRVMGLFRAGELDVLVATTVIEVGVDVPLASVMIIDNAERLGLSQLHQLRGRVGRGTTRSVCVLLYQEPLSETSQARLTVMRSTNDGFEVARKDLELRGPGEVLGKRQSGAMQFRIADLVRDQAMVPQVTQMAERVMRDYPSYVDPLIQRWLGSAERFGNV